MDATPLKKSRSLLGSNGGHKNVEDDIDIDVKRRQTPLNDFSSTPLQFNAEQGRKSTSSNVSSFRDAIRTPARTQNNGSGEEDDDGEARNNLYWAATLGLPCVWYGGDGPIGTLQLVSVTPFTCSTLASLTASRDFSTASAPPQANICGKNVTISRSNLLPLDEDVLAQFCSNGLLFDFLCSLLDYAEWDDAGKQDYIWAPWLQSLLMNPSELDDWLWTALHSPLRQQLRNTRELFTLLLCAHLYGLEDDYDERAVRATRTSPAGIDVVCSDQLQDLVQEIRNLRRPCFDDIQANAASEWVGGAGAGALNVPSLSPAAASPSASVSPASGLSLSPFRSPTRRRIHFSRTGSRVGDNYQVLDLPTLITSPEDREKDWEQYEAELASATPGAGAGAITEQQSHGSEVQIKQEHTTSIQQQQRQSNSCMFSPARYALAQVDEERMHFESCVEQLRQECIRSGTIVLTPSHAHVMSMQSLLPAVKSEESVVSNVDELASRVCACAEVTQDIGDDISVHTTSIDFTEQVLQRLPRFQHQKLLKLLESSSADAPLQSNAESPPQQTQQGAVENALIIARVCLVVPSDVSQAPELIQKLDSDDFCRQLIRSQGQQHKLVPMLTETTTPISMNVDMCCVTNGVSVWWVPTHLLSHRVLLEDCVYECLHQSGYNYMVALGLLQEWMKEFNNAQFVADNHTRTQTSWGWVDAIDAGVIPIAKLARSSHNRRRGAGSRSATPSGGGSRRGNSRRGISEPSAGVDQHQEQLEHQLEVFVEQEEVNVHRHSTRSRGTHTLMAQEFIQAHTHKRRGFSVTPRSTSTSASRRSRSHGRGRGSRTRNRRAKAAEGSEGDSSSSSDSEDDDEQDQDQEQDQQEKVSNDGDDNDDESSVTSDLDGNAAHTQPAAESHKHGHKHEPEAMDVEEGNVHARDDINVDDEGEDDNNSDNDDDSDDEPEDDNNEKVQLSAPPQQDLGRKTRRIAQPNKLFDAHMFEMPSKSMSHARTSASATASAAGSATVTTAVTGKASTATNKPRSAAHLGKKQQPTVAEAREDHGNDNDSENEDDEEEEEVEAKDEANEEEGSGNDNDSSNSDSTRTENESDNDSDSSSSSVGDEEEEAADANQTNAFSPTTPTTSTSTLTPTRTTNSGQKRKLEGSASKQAPMHNLFAFSGSADDSASSPVPSTDKLFGDSLIPDISGTSTGDIVAPVETETVAKSRGRPRQSQEMLQQLQQQLHQNVIHEFEEEHEMYGIFKVDPSPLTVTHDRSTTSRGSSSRRSSTSSTTQQRNRSGSGRKSGSSRISSKRVREEVETQEFEDKEDNPDGQDDQDETVAQEGEEEPMKKKQRRRRRTPEEMALAHMRTQQQQLLEGKVRQTRYSTRGNDPNLVNAAKGPDQQEMPLCIEPKPTNRGKYTRTPKHTRREETEGSGAVDGLSPEGISADVAVGKKAAEASEDGHVNEEDAESTETEDEEDDGWYQKIGSPAILRRWTLFEFMTLVDVIRRCRGLVRMIDRRFTRIMRSTKSLTHTHHDDVTPMEAADMFHRFAYALKVGDAVLHLDTIAADAATTAAATGTSTTNAVTTSAATTATQESDAEAHVETKPHTGGPRNFVPNLWPTHVIPYNPHNIYYLKQTQSPCVCVGIDTQSPVGDRGGGGGVVNLKIVVIASSTYHHEVSVPAGALAPFSHPLLHAPAGTDEAFACAMMDFFVWEETLGEQNHPQAWNECVWYRYPDFFYRFFQHPPTWSTWRKQAERATRGKSGDNKRTSYFQALVAEMQQLPGDDLWTRLQLGRRVPWNDNDPVLLAKQFAHTRRGDNSTAQTVQQQQQGQDNGSESGDTDTETTTSTLTHKGRGSTKPTPSPATVPEGPPPRAPREMRQGVPWSAYNLYWLPRASLPCLFVSKAESPKHRSKEARLEALIDQWRSDAFTVQPICCITYHYRVQVTTRQLEPLTLQLLKKCTDERTQDFTMALIDFAQWQVKNHNNNNFPAGMMESLLAKGFTTSEPYSYDWPASVFDLISRPAIWAPWRKTAERTIGAGTTRRGAYFKALVDDYQSTQPSRQLQQTQQVPIKEEERDDQDEQEGEEDEEEETTEEKSQLRTNEAVDAMIVESAQPVAAAEAEVEEAAVSNPVEVAESQTKLLAPMEVEPQLEEGTDQQRPVVDAQAKRRGRGRAKKQIASSEAVSEMKEDESGAAVVAEEGEAPARKKGRGRPLGSGCRSHVSKPNNTRNTGNVVATDKESEILGVAMEQPAVTNTSPAVPAAETSVAAAAVAPTEHAVDLSQIFTYHPHISPLSLYWLARSDLPCIRISNAVTPVSSSSSAFAETGSRTCEAHVLLPVCCETYHYPVIIPTKQLVPLTLELLSSCNDERTQDFAQAMMEYAEWAVRKELTAGTLVLPTTVSEHNEVQDETDGEGKSRLRLLELFQSSGDGSGADGDKKLFVFAWPKSIRQMLRTPREWSAWRKNAERKYFNRSMKTRKTAYLSALVHDHQQLLQLDQQTGAKITRTIAPLDKTDLEDETVQVLL